MSIKSMRISGRDVEYTVIDDGCERPMTTWERFLFTHPKINRRWITQAARRFILRVLRVRTCEKCECIHRNLRKAPARTCYVDRDQPQPLLCPDCMQEWNDYWDEMWDDYYRSVL